MSSVRLVDLVGQSDAKLHGDGDTVITGIASTQSTQTGNIMFVMSPKYREHLDVCQASAVVMMQDDLPFAKSAALVMKNLYLTYAHMAQILDVTPQPTQDIVLSVAIDAMTKLGNNVSAGVNAIIEPGVELGDNVVIGAGCFVGKNIKVSADSHLWADVMIYHDIQIGKNCLIQPSTVAGSGEFGYMNDRGNWVKILQPNHVVIGDRVEIDAYTATDRGTLDDTVIDNGVIIDNQCQIAYNVMIGDNTAVAGGIIMVGSPKTGRYCMISGASVINGYMEVCDKVTVADTGMVMRLITEPGAYSSGIPLQSDKVWRKTAVLVVNIDDMSKCLGTTEHKANQQN